MFSHNVQFSLKINSLRNIQQQSWRPEMWNAVKNSNSKWKGWAHFVLGTRRSLTKAVTRRNGFYIWFFCWNGSGVERCTSMGKRLPSVSNELYKCCIFNSAYLAKHTMTKTDFQMVKSEEHISAIGALVRGRVGVKNKRHLLPYHFPEVWRFSVLNYITLLPYFLNSGFNTSDHAVA